MFLLNIIAARLKRLIYDAVGAKIDISFANSKGELIDISRSNSLSS